MPADGLNLDVDPSGDAQVTLFGFLRVLAAAAGRGKVSRSQLGVAMFVALECNGLTGLGATIDASRISAELGISERQVWRHFTAMCQLGWFEQTHKPTRGYRGEAGRRARYRLTSPRLDMTGVVQLPKRPEGTSDESAEAAESHDSAAMDRLTVSVESNDVGEPGLGTVSPSDGSPSDGNPYGPVPASATDCARDNEVEIKILGVGDVGRAAYESTRAAYRQAVAQ